MKVVVDKAPSLVGPWVAQRALCQYHHGDTAIGLWDTERETLVAGLLYQDHTGTSVTMHQAIAAPGVITRDFLWFVFYYPFVQLNCSRLTGFVRDDNTAAITLNRKLGFELEAELERGYPGGSILVFRMFKENCRWLERGKRNGKQGQRTSNT